MTSIDMVLNNSYEQGVEDGYNKAIDDVLKLDKCNHYDMYDELMYQSIKIDDIKQLKGDKK